MKIRPWGRNIYVKLDKVGEGITDGGIILPEMHSEESRVGTILSMGDRVNSNREDGERFLEQGMRVLIQFYAGVAIHLVSSDITDDTHRIITESNVLGVVEEG